MTEQIEQYMRTLKLGGLAKEWRSISYYGDPEQYVKELLELRERETNRINRMVKTAGFQVIKTLEDFVWNRNIKQRIDPVIHGGTGFSEKQREPDFSGFRGDR